MYTLAAINFLNLIPVYKSKKAVGEHKHTVLCNLALINASTALLNLPLQILPVSL